jgi:hypothetical protein
MPITHFGSDPDAAILELFSGSADHPVHTESWYGARMRTGVAPLATGSTYAIVVVGPGLRRVHGVGWWNPPSFAIVATSAQ